MTTAEDSEQPSRRGRRVPPPWLVFLAGIGLILTGGLRYLTDSARSWETSVVFGVVVIVVAVVFAVKRGGLR